MVYCLNALMPSENTSFSTQTRKSEVSAIVPAMPQAAAGEPAPPETYLAYAQAVAGKTALPRLPKSGMPTLHLFGA